jgi:dihydrofolate synthase / folylpolyglutamate synthase
MPGRGLAEWLDYIERIHPKSIELGLERVAKVRDAMGRSSSAVRIMVAGTNGKGSTCAMLESILLAAGYKVGLYTSPHLLRYNERIRLDGTPVGDERLCAAFEAVENARGEVALTYFEFGTLAAWEIFSSRPLDVVVLEVGLGGRLDAVNAFDADCAVLTSVDLDHMDYLGDTRERIGAEKAGIFRAGRPAIVADRDPPRSVLAHADAVGAQLRLIDRDFGFRQQGQQWMYWGPNARRGGLAAPALRGERQLANAAAALAALDALRVRLPIAMQDVRNGLARVELPARFQVLPGRPAVVLDVAHNPQAARVLADNLSDMGFFPQSHAVFGMLKDKDIDGVCRALKDKFSTWSVAGLAVPRGATADALANALRAAGASGEVACFKNPLEAYAAARKRSGENDRIVVFGSFHTVAEVMQGTEAARIEAREARRGL